MRKLSLEILTAASIRRPQSSSNAEKAEKDAGRAYEYWLALQIVLDNFMWVAVASPRFLLFPLMPHKLRIIGTAIYDLTQHMTVMVDEELSLTNQEESGTLTILGSFVKALQARPSQEHELHTSSKYLNLDEVLGNLFLINLAG